jgi:hypothetical protein
MSPALPPLENLRFCRRLLPCLQRAPRSASTCPSRSSFRRLHLSHSTKCAFAATATPPPPLPLSTPALHPPACSYTVQYFVWFFSFLPLALARLPLNANPRHRTLLPSLVLAGKRSCCTHRSSHPAAAVAVWAAAQGSWLSQAYLLEFRGEAVHHTVLQLLLLSPHAACDAVQVWVCGLALLGAHALLALVFLFWHRGAGRDAKQKV